ncbi:MAG: hypothetical protein R3B48_23090 [Kofleriaceae bacterium]
MKPAPRRLAALMMFSLGLVALAACSRGQAAREVPAEQARDLLLNRNWIDRMPQNHSDHLYVFRFVPSMGGGVFQDRTLFKGLFELFTFEATASEIRFVLPETRERVRSTYKIERVDGPAPFDLRLTIPESPRGPKVYFGIRSETDRDGQQLEQRLAARAKTLP